MALELSISAYERNAKNFNKKGLRRQFYSIYTHQNEYVSQAPLATTTKYVFEVTIDKEFVVSFSELLKNEGFKVLGSENTYFLENLVDQFEVNKSNFANINEDAIIAIKKDLDLMRERNKDYKDIANDDSVFYFMPYNEGIDSLYEFIKTKKYLILDFAKKNDITIMFKVLGYLNQVDGFLGFNFFDADKKDEDVIIDYAARITIMVDFNSRGSVFASGILLAGIGETEEELLDSDVNVHILAENAKYTK
jgi:hypothetical protein